MSIVKIAVTQSMNIKAAIEEEKELEDSSKATEEENSSDTVSDRLVLVFNQLELY